MTFQQALYIIAPLVMIGLTALLARRPCQTKKSRFQPPNAVFGIVWSFLMVLMCIHGNQIALSDDSEIHWLFWGLMIMIGPGWYLAAQSCDPCFQLRITMGALIITALLFLRGDRLELEFNKLWLFQIIWLCCATFLAVDSM